MAGLELGLQDRHGEPVAAALDAAKRHIGERSMEIELLRERARAAEQRLPVAMREVATMSATTSAATGRCFGIQRVCQVWERSRSALYARRARAPHRVGAGPARRGPRPRQSAAQLLAAIRADLARSPGPRRRPSQGPRTASDPGWDPSRSHAGAARHAGARAPLPVPRASGRREGPRTGGVITQAPNVMWGTDGVRVCTLDDGWGWIFAAVEHWNAECVGWPRVQSREPLRGTRSDCARARTSLWLAGRRRRPRAGASDGSRESVPVRPLPQADPVLGDPPQLRLCRGTGNERCGGSGGIARSRSKRSTAEIFQNLEAVRAAVADCVERYNQTWRLEKLGYQTPDRSARGVMSYARRHSTNVCPGNRGAVHVEARGRARPRARNGPC